MPDVFSQPVSYKFLNGISQFGYVIFTKQKKMYGKIKNLVLVVLSIRDKELLIFKDLFFMSAQQVATNSSDFTLLKIFFFICVRKPQ